MQKFDEKDLVFCHRQEYNICNWKSRRIIWFRTSWRDGKTTKEKWIWLRWLLKTNKTNKENDQIDELKKVICSYFQISENDLVSSSRKPNVVYARNLCFYIIREEFKAQFKKIGELFNKKDHTSVMYGVDKIKSSLETDSNTKKDLQYIKNKLSE